MRRSRAGPPASSANANDETHAAGGAAWGTDTPDIDAAIDALPAVARARLAGIAAELAAYYAAAMEFAVRHVRKSDKAGIIAMMKAAKQAQLASARERVMLDTADARAELCLQRRRKDVVVGL